MYRLHRTCLIVLAVLWAAGDYQLTRAQEMSSDDVDVSRVRIVAAALATREHWRVALKKKDRIVEGGIKREERIVQPVGRARNTSS